MRIDIQPTQLKDFDAVMRLYDDAIAYQKEVGNNHWFGFEREFVEKEIADNRHFIIFADENMVGTFGITLGDPHIWTDSNETPAIYIHRVATSRDARGMKLFTRILHWAKQFAEDNRLTYIRIDTGEGNDRLINYYKSIGFTYIGDTKIAYEPGMPEHYKDGLFALFQMVV